MDYGLMILADNRYNQEKLQALPQWIQAFIQPEHLNIQTNLAVSLVKKFFLNMALNPKISEDLNQELTSSNKGN